MRKLGLILFCCSIPYLLSACSPESNLSSVALCDLAGNGKAIKHKLDQNEIAIFEQNTGSMLPAIHPGDILLVDQSSLYETSPNPGQIIAFWKDNSFRRCEIDGVSQPCKETLIKRLIAIGPAELQISQGKLYMNGIELTDSDFERDYVTRNSEPRNPAVRAPEGATFQISEGEYFVLGDNTRNSSDSRYWRPVKSEQLIGIVFAASQTPVTLQDYEQDQDSLDLVNLNSIFSPEKTHFFSNYCEA